MAKKNSGVSKPATVDSNKIFGSFISGYGGASDEWKPKDGKSIIRILPKGGVLPSDWTTPYWATVQGAHSNIGQSLQEHVLCPRLTYSKPCPLCNFVFGLYNGDESDKVLAKTMRSYHRISANIIDISDIDAGVQVFSFGKKLAEKIMGLLDDPDYEDMLDPVNGRNFVVIKKQVGGFNNYDESRPDANPSKLSGIYPNWEKECHDLKARIKPVGYDELVKMLATTKQALLESSSNAEVGVNHTKPDTTDVGAGKESEDTVPDNNSEPPVKEEEIASDASTQSIKDRLNNL